MGKGLVITQGNTVLMASRDHSGLTKPASHPFSITLTCLGSGQKGLKKKKKRKGRRKGHPKLVDIKAEVQDG